MAVHDDHQFDLLARALAMGTPRRLVLKGLLGTALGATLAQAAPSIAGALTTCSQNGAANQCPGSTCCHFNQAGQGTCCQPGLPICTGNGTGCCTSDKACYSQCCGPQQMCSGTYTNAASVCQCPTKTTKCGMSCCGGTTPYCDPTGGGSCLSSCPACTEPVNNVCTPCSAVNSQFGTPKCCCGATCVASCLGAALLGGCGAKDTCIDGKCSCKSGTTALVVIDPTTGSSSSVCCANGQVCTNARGQERCCPPGECCDPSGACVAAGAACPSIAGATCCNSTCVNFQTSNANCGSCGNACPSGSSCCAGACISLQTSNTNCGICGNTCAAGTTCCNGKCVNLQTDAKNCGSCGHACPSGNTCTAGTCTSTATCPSTVAATCQTGECCDWICVPNGVACPSGGVCTAGTCGTGHTCPGACPAGECCDWICVGSGSPCLGSGGVCTNGTCADALTCIAAGGTTINAAFGCSTLSSTGACTGTPTGVGPDYYCASIGKMLNGNPLSCSPFRTPGSNTCVCASNGGFALVNCTSNQDCTNAGYPGDICVTVPGISANTNNTACVAPC